MAISRVVIGGNTSNIKVLELFLDSLTARIKDRPSFATEITVVSN